MNEKQRFWALTVLLLTSIVLLLLANKLLSGSTLLQ
jgi:hypothetical protein